MIEPVEEPTSQEDYADTDPLKGAARVGRSTLIMAVATTLSRITGFVRTWALAFALGTTAAASAYGTANDVPNMLFELIAGGILSSIFIPTFMDIRKKRGDEAAWRFAGNLMCLVTLILGTIALIGILFPQPIMWTQYFLQGDAGYSAELLALASFFFRFFAIQVVFYGVGMIIQAVLNAQRKYLWASLGPVFNNLVVIGFLLAAAYMPLDNRTFTIIGLGTSLGVLIMFLVMLPSLKKTGFKLYLGINLRDPELHRMIKLALPMILYVVCNLVAVSVRNATAASIGTDAQAIVRFAIIWQSLPYGIIAVSVSTALFTELSKAATEERMIAFKKTLVSGLRITTLLMLPASALLFGLAEPLISFYVAGRMSAENAAPIVNVLRVWTLSLGFFAAMMYLLRAFYALRDTWTPAIANFACTLVQVGGYLVLTGALLPVAAFEVIGIPLADGLYFFLFFLTLLILLRRKIGSFDIRQFIVVFAKMLVIAVLVGATAFYGSQYLTYLLNPGRLMTVAIILICGLAGLIVTFVATRLLGVEEITSFTTKVKRKLFKQ